MLEPLQLQSWPRNQIPQPRPAGAVTQSAQLYYAIFGRFAQPLELSAARYKFAGIPDGLKVSLLTGELKQDVLDDCHSIKPLRESFEQLAPELQREVDAAPECVLMIGEFDGDRLDNLDYMRDTMGFVSALFGNGGVALYDPMQFRWWCEMDWLRSVYEPAMPNPLDHVLILQSPDTVFDTNWLYTRGMRKYGRPDLSFHCVESDRLAAATALLEWLIEKMADGWLIDIDAEGLEIRMPGAASANKLLPPVICRPGGSLDDPIFNNFHVDITLKADVT